MRRLVSICAALAAVCALSPVPSSAGYVDDYVGGVNGLYADMLSDTLEYYNLSDTAATTDMTFAVGSNLGVYCTCVWIGNMGYRTIVNTNYAIPEPEYYKGDYGCRHSIAWVGAPYLCQFYYDDNGNNYYLQSVWTTSPGNYNTIASQRDTYFLSDADGSTVGDLVVRISSDLLPEDATEPTTTASGGFQLPDAWINGGQTLPAATEPTFPSGFDPEAAFSEFEDITYEIDDGVKSGIGFFWEVLTRSIDALGIWSYVFFAMLFGLIFWFLKGQ